MADVSMNLKEFNVEFDDTNTSKSANIVSGHDIKESFATIHKRLNNIGYTWGTERTIINSNADLDDYKTPGIYEMISSSYTITHSPIDDKFRMYVMSVGNDTKAQYYIPENYDCIYTRKYGDIFETWSDWKRLGEQVILSYGNSTWNDFYNAYKHNAVVYCRASSNTNPATGSQTRMAFMAYVNNGTDPTEVEFQYYRSVSSHSDSQQGDEVYVYKLIKNSGWSVTKRYAYSKLNVTAPIVKTYSNQEITLSHADSGVTAGTYDSVTVDAKGHVTAGTNYQQNAINDLYHMYYDMNVYDLDISKLMRLNTGGTWKSTIEGYEYTFNGVTYYLDITALIIEANKARTDSYLILSDVTHCKVPYRLYGGYSPMQVQYGEYISNAFDNTGVVIPANYTGNQLKITFSENSNNTVSVAPMLFPDSYTPYSLNYPDVTPGTMYAPEGIYSNYKLSQYARYRNQLGIGQVVNWATSTNHVDLNNFTKAGVYSFPIESIDYIDNAPVAHTLFKLEVSEFYGSSLLGIRQICDYTDTRWVRFGGIINSYQPVWDAWALECTIDGTAAYANITNNSTIKIGDNSYTPIAFATCDTAAGTKDKVATITGNSTWTRKIGSIVAVKYSNTNTYDANNTTSGTGSVTLNVNGTGAANIYYGATANPTGTNTAAFGYANRYIYYMWDGTYWIWLSQSTDNNTTYSGMTAAEIRAGTGTSARLITPANLNLANYGLGTALKADDDLNSTSIIPVTRGNRYYGSSTQICKSIKHRPDYANSSSVIFMIETKITTSATSGSERMIMIMYTRNTTTNDTNIYYRSYAGTWGSWKQVTDSTVSDYVPS